MRRTAFALILGLIAALTLPVAAGATATYAATSTTNSAAGATAVYAAGSAANSTAAFAVESRVPIAPTSVDDFEFASMEADYYLARDEEGHSTLRTVEKLVAVFPETDQNRGIRRAIPNRYDGHPVDLKILRVTDENGEPRKFEVEEDDDDDFTIVTVAAKNYVHGAQTYVLEYTQRNVTLVPDNATAQNGNEFYWDVNGTGWKQPFHEVTATVHLAPEVSQGFTGQASCYSGRQGSADKCAELDVTEGSSGPIVRAVAKDLGAGQNLTVALGFEADTFVPRDDSFFSSWSGYVQLIGFVGLIAVALIGLVMRRTRWRDHPGRGTIIPEYLPPKGVDLFTSGLLHGQKAKATAAEFLSLAVRHKVRVLEEQPRTMFGKKPQYSLELISRAGVTGAELELTKALFGEPLEPGARRNLSASDSKLSTAITRILKSAKKKLVTDGYRRKPAGNTSARLVLFAVLALVLTVVAGVASGVQEIGDGFPFLILIAGGILFFVIIALVTDVRPLTEKGAELRDYLRGLEMYIKLAETDRMRVLQSPEGALRSEYRPVGQPTAAFFTSRPGESAQYADQQVDPAQIVKLYERLLPFAVLFGLEKDWAKVLGEYYAQDNSQPDWYAGQGTFNAAVFAAGIGSLTSAASSSWSGSASSSSSGGSGGGGFSGGGGGGGGGGGV